MKTKMKRVSSEFDAEIIKFQAVLSKLVKKKVSYTQATRLIEIPDNKQLEKLIKKLL